MRRPLVAGNWKMHNTRAEAAALVEAIAGRLEDPAPVEVAVCPPFTALGRVAGALPSWAWLGAQDCHRETSGAFTGAVSAPMLAEAGCRYVITGHSERRTLFGETDADHVYVQKEQMMPFVPVVPVPDFETGVREAKRAESGYGHSAIIHSTNVEHMTHMGKEMDTTLYVKNGSCVTGLGLGGEGYLSYSIATTTGEGITTPKTFTRVRRCVMVENLRIV